MACGKNTNGENMRSLCGSHLSNDLAPSAPILSWAPSQAMCTTYSINSSQVMQQQVRETHDSFQAKGNYMPDMPRGICEDNTPYSLHTSKEAPTCTHTHSLDEDKSRILTDGNISLAKNDLDHHADDNLQQLEEYVNELVPALHAVTKSTHNMDIAHRQEAIRLIADALLVRRAPAGMAWSDTLSKRVSNYCNKAHGHQGNIEILDNLAEIPIEDPDYMLSLECAASSCIRTPVSSEGTNSCEFSDHDFSTFHHGSTASIASSDHNSMVGSTSELLQDDMDALNYVQSGVSLRPLMEINVSSSDAHMSSVNSSGDQLLSMCKQGKNHDQLKSVDQLHEEINARLAMIRSCCKEWNEDAGIAKKSSTSALESLQVASSTREEHVCIINDTSADVKDYHLMRMHSLHHHGVSHSGEGRRSFHVMHHDVPCGQADVAHSERTRYDSAAVTQLPCADVHNGHEVACRDADVACNVFHTVDDVAFQRADVATCNSAEVALGKPKQYEMAVGNADMAARDMTGLQGIHMRGKAAIDDEADEVDVYCDDDVDSEVEGKMEAKLQQGMPWLHRPAEDDVADELANEEAQVGAEVEGRLRWQQAGLTWQGSTYLPSTDDVLYGAEVDAQVEKGSHRGNNKMREMMYRVAAYQPIDWETIMEEVVGKERPGRRNVRISKEPQSVAARRRRERISDRIRILQRLVPGTSKLDTASMLDEAIHYLKFLKLQVQALHRVDKLFTSLPLPLATSESCPLHIAPPYPLSTPTLSHFHPFPFQI